MFVFAAQYEHGRYDLSAWLGDGRWQTIRDSCKVLFGIRAAASVFLLFSLGMQC
jgi:hypothetical protein